MEIPPSDEFAWRLDEDWQFPGHQPVMIRDRVRCLSLSLSPGTRFISHLAPLSSIDDEPLPRPSLTYLDGFAKPCPAPTILAIPRLASGKGISVKERKSGRVPSIVFEQADGERGGNKRLISVRTNQIRNLVVKFGRSFFLSRLFQLEVRPEFETNKIIEQVRVLPRLIHLHAKTDVPINVTFIRAPSNALLKVDVPLVFRGEDASPGLRKGAYFNIIKRTVRCLSPADIIPPYIDVDISGLDIGKKIVAGDLNVHPALKLALPRDQPVCKIMAGRASD